MRASSIKKHLRVFKVASRRSTFNHALASALAPYDDYNAEEVQRALDLLEQKSNEDLTCNYCGRPAATWDHINNIVVRSSFSGYGHRLGNLLPCCRTCNERKGNQHWLHFLKSLNLDEPTFQARKAAISAYIEHFPLSDMIPQNSPSYLQYKALQQRLHTLLHEADELAEKVRNEMAQRSKVNQLADGSPS